MDKVHHEIIGTCRGGGYLYARTSPPHPRNNSNGLYPLHRVVAENTAGRYLRDSEVVHHRNGDKNDNTPENLEIMQSSAHSRIHAKPLAMAEAKCNFCGKVFSIAMSQLRARLKKNQDGRVYCSRSCGASQ